jgi:hypothetical protein
MSEARDTIPTFAVIMGGYADARGATERAAAALTRDLGQLQSLVPGADLKDVPTTLPTLAQVTASPIVE